MDERKPDFYQPNAVRAMVDKMAFDAQIDGRDPPVIYTDFASSLTLIECIGDTLGMAMDIRNARLYHECANHPDCLGIYNGVKIMIHRKPEQLERRAWKEHFGALTDIYEGQLS